MQTKHVPDPGALLAIGEAAELLGVHPETLKRWERAGRITALRTPTGHRRFRRGEVERLLTDDSPTPARSAS